MKKSVIWGLGVLVLCLMGVSVYLGYFIHMKFGNEKEKEIPKEKVMQDLEVIPSPKVNIQDETTTKEAPLTFSNLVPEQTIKSPVSIVGEAPGRYFFEGSFPVMVVDAHGKVIGDGIATAQGDWMTEKMVPFHTDIQFEWKPIGMGEEPLPPTGFLIFQKDNPSDMRENDEEYRVPITFQESEDEKSVPSSKEEREKDGCVISGCSAQVCSDEKVLTDCMYKEEYICFQKALCERQRNGKCEWTMSKDISACVAQF
ncbi:MAG: hypothetical protein COV59_00665 [Candidatus Magasanikbacteria bacterium CG11_big_fil_rev_8_21_14_0_20_39_34]|uniref:Bacterial spore germination immunoglobulin-like domain-containing protein n=1 Tax=Candidatus Magasanikbacteria bacterium CG11_big_fil_rev_8_21_14_0_20_39_34 TaxID=1974653 RepID=A0A2H0N6F3_9BACT|nr:MAG: hypothetical protein COV59_00665 [Candidatus Magasanikbacteria bacterium CG11_big_fil_rev_8_21_14_0_20_39_34]